MEIKAQITKKLQKYKESLSKEEIEKIIADTKELAAYQEEEESEEALETIPLLKRSDIKRESVKLYNDEHEVDGTTVLHHNVFTNGIGYLSLLFDTKNVPNDLIPYMGVLKSVPNTTPTASCSTRSMHRPAASTADCRYSAFRKMMTTAAECLASARNSCTTNWISS